jgi:4-diphosphocytidyl-2-C-methyl-D-erythritol kinase
MVILLQNLNPVLMISFPNTKINIGLNITGKRNDGFHDIETIFCPAGLSDILEFVPSPDLAKGNVTFSISGVAVDGPPENNLCVKAYQLLHNDFNLPAVDIHLHKMVPPGAGLGGGSSDAAFMLKNLNKEFELGLDEEGLCDYASQLGSDCAFFIKNRPLFGFGRGNMFREIVTFPKDIYIVIINPGIHVSTAEAYAGVIPRKPSESLEDLIKAPLETWKNKIINDFEEHIILKHPKIGQIKEDIYKLGAVYASMSGSGSSVYGLFKNKIPETEMLFPGLFCWKGHLFELDH